MGVAPLGYYYLSPALVVQMSPNRYKRSLALSTKVRVGLIELLNKLAKSRGGGGRQYLFNCWLLTGYVRLSNAFFNFQQPGTFHAEFSQT